MSFSNREGYEEPKHSPLGSMSGALKNDIWTEIYTIINNNYISYGTTGYGDSTYRDDNAKALWTKFFEQSISDLPHAGGFLKKIESLYKKLKWNQVYDLIEFFLKKINRKEISEKFNSILEENNSSYRIMNNIVQPISDKKTIEIMESAYNDAPNKEIQNHLINAQNFYSNKQNPNFSNSCLESIKAVEAVCRFILHNDKTLGDNVKELKNNKNYDQHIIAVLEKIYAFRNDNSAHAKKPGGYQPNRDDAMLIHAICCGFINYFKSGNKNR